MFIYTESRLACWRDLTKSQERSANVVCFKHPTPVRKCVFSKGCKYLATYTNNEVLRVFSVRFVAQINVLYEGIAHENEHKLGTHVHTQRHTAHARMHSHAHRTHSHYVIRTRGGTCAHSRVHTNARTRNHSRTQFHRTKRAVKEKGVSKEMSMRSGSPTSK